MAETIGLNLRAGFVREAIVTTATWPAATSAALTALLPLLDVRLNDGVETEPHDGASSGLGPEALVVTSVTPTASLSVKARYEGFEALWACALGYMAKRIGTTVMPELLATGVYRHLLEIDARLSTAEAWDGDADGFLSGELSANQRKVRRGTFAVDMQVSVWELLSGMVQSLTLAAEPGGVTLAMELAAYSLGRSSAVNTSATMLKLLPPTAPTVLFTDLAWRVAPHSTTTPLASGDAVQCTSWSLRLDNRLESSPGPRTGTAPEEYERTGPPTIDVSFVAPRHTADTWQTRWGAGTVLMADAKFTSAQEVAAGQPYKLNLYLPSCQVEQAILGTSGPLVPPDTITLRAVIPTAAAAGFPAMKKSTTLAVEVVSGSSAHPLL